MSTTALPKRKVPAPVPTLESQPFFDAASQGRLLVKRCRSCEQTHFYPRLLCPFCLSDATEWVDAAGTGEIYTFSVIRQNKGQEPYVLAYVTLDEGVSMMTNIVDADPASLQIGQRVKVVFHETENGPPVTMFTPV